MKCGPAPRKAAGSGSSAMCREHAEYGRAFELWILLDDHFKTVLRERVLDLLQSAMLVVDLDHDLADEVPMLFPDSRQNFSLTLLDIHFQQIDPRHALLVHDLGERPQAARERLLLELGAEKQVGM